MANGALPFHRPACDLAGRGAVERLHNLGIRRLSIFERPARDEEHPARGAHLDAMTHKGLKLESPRGDIHLVPQNPNTAAFAVPSKVFNIMAVGRPFVATAQTSFEVRQGGVAYNISEFGVCPFPRLVPCRNERASKMRLFMRI